jgi:hypothetical protein
MQNPSALLEHDIEVEDIYDSMGLDAPIFNHHHRDRDRDRERRPQPRAVRAGEAAASGRWRVDGRRVNKSPVPAGVAEDQTDVHADLLADWFPEHKETIGGGLCASTNGSHAQCAGGEGGALQAGDVASSGVMSSPTEAAGLLEPEPELAVPGLGCGAGAHSDRERWKERAAAAGVRLQGADRDRALYFAQHVVAAARPPAGCSGSGWLAAADPSADTSDPKAAALAPGKGGLIIVELHHSGPTTELHDDEHSDEMADTPPAGGASPSRGALMLRPLAQTTAGGRIKDYSKVRSRVQARLGVSERSQFTPLQKLSV